MCPREALRSARGQTEAEAVELCEPDGAFQSAVLAGTLPVDDQMVVDSLLGMAVERLPSTGFGVEVFALHPNSGTNQSLAASNTVSLVPAVGRQALRVGGLGVGDRLGSLSSGGPLWRACTQPHQRAPDQTHRSLESGGSWTRRPRSFPRSASTAGSVPWVG